MNNSYHYMHIWLVEALGLILHKASFSVQQMNIFYLTTKLVENIEKVPPTQSQININNPTNYLSNVMRSRIVVVPARKQS